jgi:hypothetical protein
MRTMLLAALAAFSLGGASAHADGGGFATTRFTMIQDQLAGEGTPVRQLSQKDQVIHMELGQADTMIFRAGNSSLGTWLFPPSDGGGQN